MPNDRPSTDASDIVPRTHQSTTIPLDRAGSVARLHGQNRLLAALSDDDYAWLSPMLEPVDLPVKRILASPGSAVTHVYFPVIGVASMINRTGDGSVVEVGTIGAEGMTGLQSVLSDVPLPSETFIQVAGHGFRAPAAVARGAAERPGFRRVLDRYTQALLVQVAQTATCNLLHPIDERCARWLLITHDRMGGADTFDLTHEFLAFMLGVRRAGVTVAAGLLARAGIIRYARGRVTVLDRAGLEAASCECYRLVHVQFERLVGGESPSVPDAAVQSA